jgi:hypothetical protein
VPHCRIFLQKRPLLLVESREADHGAKVPGCAALLWGLASRVVDRLGPSVRHLFEVPSGAHGD